MSLKDQLGVRIEGHALLKHPFYKAWEAGALPQPALQAYASEYGAFIATMPHGWETLNDEETAQEEADINFFKNGQGSLPIIKHIQVITLMVISISYIFQGKGIAFFIVDTFSKSTCLFCIKYCIGERDSHQRSTEGIECINF